MYLKNKDFLDTKINPNFPNSKPNFLTNINSEKDESQRLDRLWELILCDKLRE
jgi:hypothetical protein